MSNTKLPKFLQKHPNRERSNSKSEGLDDSAIVVEPIRSRSRSERPEPTHIGGDLPTRLSGWFQHAFSTSSTDVSTLLAQQTASPKGKGPNPFLTAAKHGKGHLDKAMRYLLDPDATPDKSTDPIWLLGVQHLAFEPSLSEHREKNKKRRGSGGSPTTSLRSSTSSPIDPLTQSTSSITSTKQSSHKQDPAAYWPPAFYLDFTSRVWLTYRSQFPLPIRDGRLADLCQGNWEDVACSPATTGRRAWPWGGEKTWSSDTGWGCMLRTGQSLLANALVHVHLGRDWRRPPYPVQTADYATYVQILTWFLDTPSPEAPFSVHRMALAGKEYGTDVGQWFGPSVAAGAIRTLVSQYLECGLAVSVATDSILYQSQVFGASHGDTNYRSPRRAAAKTWGDRPVLLLLGIRLGIEGVNPIYYETIRRLYQFPQSVGIAGGRPSSSYYFVGSQGDNLFYLDPHNQRPAIPLRSPQDSDQQSVSENRHSIASLSNSDTDSASQKQKSKSPVPPVAPRTPAKSAPKSRHTPSHQRTPTSPSSSRTGSSSISSHHVPTSPSPLQQQLSTSSADSSYSTTSSSFQEHRSPPPSYSAARAAQGHHSRWRSSSHSQPASPRMSSPELDYRDLGIHGSSGPSLEVTQGEDLDPVQKHFCTAYTDAELKTFHCERVRKMHLSGLDPSMLIGFLCRNEMEWWDFKKRVEDLPKTIFSIQDEPPTWPSDSDDNMGLESMSEPDDFDLNDDEDDDVEEDDDNDNDEPFFDTLSAQSASASSQSHAGRSDKGNKSEEIDTEEDPVGPVTPGPASRFELVTPVTVKRRDQRKASNESDEEDEEGSIISAPAGEFGDEDDDIEDDWIDPSLPTPTSGPPQSASMVLPSTPSKGSRATAKDPSPSPPSSTNVPPLTKSRSSSSSKYEHKSKSSKSRKKAVKQTPVPVPAVRIPQQQEHYPFPVTPADEGSNSPRSGDRSRQSSATRVPKQPRMHTARARDGGRTQSGGVKGILPSDSI